MYLLFLGMHDTLVNSYVMAFLFSFGLHSAPGGAPQLVTAEAITPTVLVLKWQPPLAEDVNGVVRSYAVNITELETGRLNQYLSSDLNITVEMLHPFYRYRYIVAAETISLGPFTDPSVIHMPEAGK